MRRAWFRHVAVLGVAVLALVAGCGDDGAVSPESEPAESSETPTETPDETPTEDPMSDDGPLAQAIADLAQQAGVAPDDIEVVAHDPVTWRDGSLGCPEPGMMYTQALVDGYRIVLRVAGAEVAYHGGGGRPPFRCDHPDPNGAVR